MICKIWVGVSFGVFFRAGVEGGGGWLADAKLFLIPARNLSICELDGLPSPLVSPRLAVFIKREVRCTLFKFVFSDMVNMYFLRFNVKSF